jgi:hypothetical protein
MIEYQQLEPIKGRSSHDRNIASGHTGLLGASAQPWQERERTLYTYGKDFRQIEGFFGSERKLSAILTPHVGKFFKSDVLLKLPSGRERFQPTVEKTKRALRMFLIWARETGRIDNLPLPKDTPWAGA